MSLEYEFPSQSFSLNLFMVFMCLIFAFIAAGLTMGLISLEVEKVKALMAADEKNAASEDEKIKLRKQKKYATKLLPLISNHHRLLVTLLLTNACANEALPLFLNQVVPPWAAVIVATTLVLIFGEIIPSAVFTGPMQLRISSFFSPVVLLFQCLLSCIVFPIAVFLDRLLGEHHRGRYNSCELIAFLGGEQIDSVKDDTKKMMVGAIHAETYMVSQPGIYTPMSDVFMLPMDAKMDQETMASILHSGYSRVPVYEFDKHNIRGMLIIKRLITLDPKDERSVSSLQLKMPLVFTMQTTLRDALNTFQMGASHVALVVSDSESVQRAWRTNKPIPPDVHMVGIVTIESVLEQILAERITDEDDRRKNIILAGARCSKRVHAVDGQLDDPTVEVQLMIWAFRSWFRAKCFCKHHAQDAQDVTQRSKSDRYCDNPGLVAAIARSASDDGSATRKAADRTKKVSLQSERLSSVGDPWDLRQPLLPLHKEP